MKGLFYFIFLIIFISSKSILGQEVINVEYLIDSSANLSIHQIENNSKFQTLDQPNLGFNDKPHWVKVEVSGLSTDDFSIIEVAHPSLDSVVFYRRNTEGEWIEEISGHSLNPERKSITSINFPFIFEANQTSSTFYFRIQSTSALVIPIELFKLNEYNNATRTRNLLLGGFFGLMFIMAIYNLLLYTSLKDRAYLLYVGTAVFGLITTLVTNGVAYIYFWPNQPDWDSHLYVTFAGLSMMCSSQFAADFLNLRKNYKRLHVFMWVITGLSFLMSLLSLFYTDQEILGFARWLVLLAFPSYIVVGIYVYRKGYRPALFYIIAWVPYMLGLVLTTLRGAGWVPDVFVARHGIEIGGALEIVLLSLALAARIKALRKEVTEKELEKEQFKTKLLNEQKGLLERTVEERTAELKEANQTKDMFFSIIAHDLRSPMVGLQGVGKKLEHYIKKNKQEKLLKLGGQIDRSVDRLNHLLNNLLNWAVSERGSIPVNPENLNLKEVIQENIELYTNAASDKKITIHTDLEEIQNTFDLNTISTIIRNLLSNAIKFSPEEERIEIKLLKDQENILFSIRDYGEGMPQEVLKQLESRQMVTKKGRHGEQGFGLGLQLCRQFVDMNHGELKIERMPERGTCFTVLIPSKG